MIVKVASGEMNSNVDQRLQRIRMAIDRIVVGGQLAVGGWWLVVGGWWLVFDASPYLDSLHST